jgi:hypothetical protein
VKKNLEVAVRRFEKQNNRRARQKESIFEVGGIRSFTLPERDCRV